VSRLYRRQVLLSVGPAGELGRQWSDLAISFKVGKTQRKRPNRAEIEVTNLSPDSRAYIEEKDLVVVLQAGYETPPPRLFIGDIAEVTHRRSGTDIITTIEAGDGEKRFQLGHINESFDSGTTNRQVLRRIAQVSGLGVGHIETIDEIEFVAGYVASGHIRNVLDELCESVGAQWSIQDGEFQVVVGDNGTNEIAPLLSPDTGLLGTPEPVKVQGSKAKRNNGLKLRCLLNARLRPRRYVQLSSENHVGTYLVRSVVHTGENFGPSFHSELEVTPVDVPANAVTMVI